MLSRRAAQRARNHYQPTCNSSSIVCSSALSCNDNDFVTFTQEPDDGQPPSCSTYTDDIINGCGVGLSSSKSKLVKWVDDVNDGLCSPVVVGKSSTAENKAVVATTPPEPILKKMQIVPPPESPQPEYISFNVSDSTGTVTPPQTQPSPINKQCEHLVAIEVEDDTTASLSSQSDDDDSDMTDVTTNNNGLSPKIYAYYTTSPAAVAAKAADDEKRKEHEMNQNCFTLFGLVIEPICSGAIFDTKYCGCEPFSKGEEEEALISCVPHWCKDNYTEDGKIVVEVSDDEVSQEDKVASEDAVKAQVDVDEVVVFEDGDMIMLNDIQDLNTATPTEPQEEDAPSVLERDMMLDELEVQEAIVVKEEDEPQEEQDDDDDESDTPSIWSANSNGEECTGQQAVNASPLAAMGAASTIVSSMMNSSPSDEKDDHEDDMILDVEDEAEATEDPQEEEDVVVEDEGMMTNESQDESQIDEYSNADDMTDSDMYEALLEWE